MADTFKLGKTGEVPASFEWKFKGYNFTNDANANGHNESRVSATCVDGGFFRILDGFNVSGKTTDEGKGYQLEIKLDSYSRVPLWNHGAITLYYDAKQERWSMTASTKFGSWEFCDANAVVQRLVGGLRCVAKTGVKGADVSSADVFAKSIEDGAKQIVDGAKHYFNSTGQKINDCSYDPPPHLEYDSPPVPD